MTPEAEFAPKRLPDVYYRYDDHRVSEGYIDLWDEYVHTGSRVEVVLMCCPVAKVTPKGVRLEGGRFVLSSAKKRYALPTPEEALESFKKRKMRQSAIYQARVRQAEEALKIADQITDHIPGKSVRLGRL